MKIEDKNSFKKRKLLTTDWR